jgi:type IV secretion system protein VirB4
VADPLRLADWSCFETDGLFQVAPLIAPTLAVVFHELALSFTGAPTLLGLDEAHKYLSHPVFLTKIEEWLREMRKLNVSVIFSTQDLMELLESPIATVILNNCPIRILLPNERAQETRTAKAYQEIGLNARQLELLALATPHRDYLYISKQGVRMMELAIGPYGLKVLTGREEGDTHEEPERRGGVRAGRSLAGQLHDDVLAAPDENRPGGDSRQSILRESGRVCSRAV